MENYYSLSIQVLTVTATWIAAIATGGLYYVAKRVLPDHQKEVKSLRDSEIQVVLSEPCDARTAHNDKEFLDFPDINGCPAEKQSSHFYVKSNDVLLGKRFSDGTESDPEKWDYIGVFLKNENKVDAYSDILLRHVGNQDARKWVFYGHKGQIKLEGGSSALCSSPPFYTDYRISTIHPGKNSGRKLLGVIHMSREADLTDDLDKVFKYDLFYRVLGADVPITADEIPLGQIPRRA